MSTIKNKINKYINKEGKLATPGYFISELLGDIDEKIDNLDEKTSTKIKQNSNNLKTIRANVNALESEISSNINSNISSLSYRISELKSEIESNTKKNERIISSALTDLDERINWLMDFIIKKVAVISARINVTDVTIPTKIINNKTNVIKIIIDGEEIEIMEEYQFNEVGEHKIEYYFNPNISKINNMFMDCSAITFINLYNFDITNITNMTGLFDGCTSLTSLSPFINWKQCNLNLINSSIKALDVHNIIIRSMNLSDGAVERKLILNETTKDEWTNSEYYSIDNDLLSIKGIIIE